LLANGDTLLSARASCAETLASDQAYAQAFPTQEDATTPLWTLLTQQDRCLHSADAISSLKAIQAFEQLSP
jgi:hypothetical protein